MPKHTIIPRCDRREERFVSECTVRQLTQEEIERLDKLLGPPIRPLTKRKTGYSNKPVAPQFVDENALQLPETVFISRFKRRRSQVYHIYQDCSSAKNAEPKTLGEAKKNGLRLCAFCKIRYAREGDK